MRPIQNNLSNLQINQIAAEQAALQSAKNQPTNRVRAETAGEILKQQEKNEAYPKSASPTDPNGRKKSNSQNFKNALYSKDGKPKNNADNSTGESTPISQIKRIDFKV